MSKQYHEETRLSSDKRVNFCNAIRQHGKGNTPEKTKRCSFPQEIAVAGGSPEGAEIPALSLFSPLWAFFGYFLARQKVT